MWYDTFKSVGEPHLAHAPDFELPIYFDGINPALSTTSRHRTNMLRGGELESLISPLEHQTMQVRKKDFSIKPYPSMSQRGISRNVFPEAMFANTLPREYIDSDKTNTSLIMMRECHRGQGQARAWAILELRLCLCSDTEARPLESAMKHSPSWDQLIPEYQGLYMCDCEENS